MPTQNPVSRPVRATLVTAGLALGTLGGVGAGAAVVVNLRSADPVAQTASMTRTPTASTTASAPSPVSSPTLPLARPAALTPGRAVSPAPHVVRRPPPTRRAAHPRARASRSVHRGAVRR